VRAAALVPLLALAAAAPAPAPASAVAPAQLGGQRAVWSFPGTEPPAWLLAGVRRGEVGAVLLFADNGRRPEDVRRLVDRLQAEPRPPGLDAPLLVLVDQEGGPVRRLEGGPERGHGDLARLPVSASRAAGREAGALLCRAGIGVDIAPVTDLARPGSVIARQGRSLGAGPAAVARRAAAFAAGLAENGVAAAPKHFPGLGAAQRTTDDVPVRIDLPLAELRRADLRPYRDLVARGVPAVMVATAVYRAYGPRPAALEPRVVRGELRGRLGFRGVAVADALDTPALAPYGDHARIAEASARAGVDLLPFVDPAAARRASAGVAAAVRAGRLGRADAERSLARVLTLRHMLSLGVPVLPPPGGSPAPVAASPCTS